MRTIIAVLALFYLALPARADECAMTVVQFAAKVAPYNATFQHASPQVAKHVLAFVNENRRGHGDKPVDADEFFVVLFPDGTMAISLSLAGCITPTTLVQITPPLFEKIMSDMGVNPKDFTPMKIEDGI